MIAGWKLYGLAGVLGAAALGLLYGSAYFAGKSAARAECAERAAEDIQEAAEKAVEEIAAQTVAAEAARKRLTSAADMANAARLRLKGELDALPAGSACFDPGAYERMQDLFERLFPAAPVPASGSDNGSSRDA